jgi:RNA polymerase-binding transcription factor DksA
VSFSSPGNGERATARILKRGVAVAKKAAAKKTASAKSAVKTAEAKQSATTKAPAKKAPPKKAPAKKVPAKKAPAKKAPAKKAAAVAASESSKVDEARAAAAVRLKENQKIAAKAFTKPFLKKQEAELLRVREKYTRSAVSYREEADSLVLDRDPGDVQFDEESGEGDTLSVERERDLALSAQAQQAVEEIDAALQRLKDKVYGLCVESSLPIPKERLEAIPWASQRVEFKVGGLGRR